MVMLVLCAASQDFARASWFFKCEGSFPIFFVVVKEEFSQVLIVDTGA